MNYKYKSQLCPLASLRYSLLLGEKGAPLYFFIITKTGYASAGQFIPERDTSYIKILEWNQNASESIKKRDISFIGVLKQGDSISMTVNGRPIGSFKDVIKRPL